jgi:hypothetical protein
MERQTTTPARSPSRAVKSTASSASFSSHDPLSALELLLIQRKDPQRFERAAARFVGKFARETRGVRICDLQLLLGAVAGLDGLSRRVSLEAIEALASSFQHRTLAQAAKRANRERANRIP